MQRDVALWIDHRQAVIAAVAAVETADKMTDPQIAAAARLRFRE